ncbi:PQQ-binding-like beta-propeller repeat protein [Streptomyces sp. NPDC058375]|uniref:protein kinase domain-containing protein n=1 Tax=Streptomyces sp. NPDC058375 TaxID=3346467 RepID=UPI003657E301
MFSPLAHDDPHNLGPYRLIARLGGGGMGTVYLARSSTGRTAALKTMHARIATDPASRTRFRLETDAARVIGPVHGAQVFDADPHAETPWLATEYVLGPPLDDAVALTGPLPEPTVRALGTLLCAALAQLHASEVVHRDLKPSNIMITADGPKVIDLGIARALGDDRLTRTGTAAGTPAFMSPEQATGQEHTSAGDVFALAGVLIYAATGHGPFGTGQHADLMYRVRHADPDLTGVPAALIPVLVPCLSKNPAVRPTTTELAAQLRGGQNDFSSSLPEPLLLEIGRRAGSVWHARAHRLPAPVGHALAETVPGSEPTSPSVLSRRNILKFGGSSVFAAAAVGAGAWAWRGRREGSPPDGSGTASSKRPAWDLLWQVKTSYADPLVPPAPLVLDALLLVGEHGVQGLDPATGEAKWSEPEVWFMRRTATDGEKLYAVDYTLDETGPLTVATVDPATGKIDAPFGEVKDLRAALHGTQLLCATSEAVFLAAGRGPDTDTGFHKDQTWFLLAVDTRTGKALWRAPLPARSHGSERLHFLAARAVGAYLVLVQQSEDGEPRLTVHDAQTGRALWNRQLDGVQPPFSRAHLAVDDRYVYPSAGELVALGLADGREGWRFEGRTPGALFGPATVDDGVVYAVEEGRGMVALDAASGTERWAEKNRAVTAEDLDTPPVAGIAHVYSKGPSGLMASDMRTGAVSRPFKAAKARYFAHVSAERLIAIGDEYTAAYPLA